MEKDTEMQEMLLFTIAQLFRIQCAVDRINHDIIDLRAKQTHGGIEALIKDESYLRVAKIARFSTCSEYEEMLESVKSPAIKSLFEVYFRDWCTDLQPKSVKSRKRKHRRGE